MVFLRAIRKQFKIVEALFIFLLSQQAQWWKAKRIITMETAFVYCHHLTSLTGTDEKQCAPYMRSTKAAFRAEKRSFRELLKFPFMANSLELTVKDESCTWMDVNACTVDLWHDKRGILQSESSAWHCASRASISVLLLSQCSVIAIDTRHDKMGEC